MLLGLQACGVIHDLFLVEIVAGQLADQAALAHHQDAAAHAEQLFQLGRDDDAGESIAHQVVDEAVDLAARADVDAARRFVQDQDLGRCVQPLGQVDLLLVAAAQVGQIIGQRRDADVEAVHVIVGPFLHIGDSG